MERIMDTAIMEFTGEEIIRCRDCKFHAGENDYAVNRELCHMFQALTNDDFFCAGGERSVMTNEQLLPM